MRSSAMVRAWMTMRAGWVAGLVASSGWLGGGADKAVCPEAVAGASGWLGGAGGVGWAVGGGLVDRIGAVGWVGADAVGWVAGLIGSAVGSRGTEPGSEGAGWRVTTCTSSSADCGGTSVMRRYNVDGKMESSSALEY